MIDSIKLHNCATYTGKAVEIKELKKVNYFFGFNGSGKSTIAKYLYALSQNDLGLFSCCTQTGFNHTQEELLVFDDEFIKRNFNKNNELAGIFSLNEKNKEIDDEIKDNIELKVKKMAEIEVLDGDIEKIGKENKDNKKDITSKCFEKRNIFKSFSKITLIHGGNKENNYNHIINILSSDIEKEELDDLSSKYKKLYEQDLKLIENKINIELFKSFADKEKKINDLLSEIIVGKEDVQIGKMIKEFNLKTWVETGKKFLEDTKTFCPFCQNETITDDFIKQLDDYFDKSYLEKKENLTTQKKLFEADVKSLLTNIDEVSKEYNEKNCLTDIYKNIDSYLQKALAVFDKKINATNEKYSIKSFALDLKELEEINNRIEENNTFVREKESSKEILKTSIWNYIACECKSDIEEFKKIEKENIDKLNKKDENRKDLNAEIIKITEKNKKLQEQTVNTTKSVQAINEMLKNSGFVGFSIEEKDKENNIPQYYLKRDIVQDNSDVFNTLSEGEKNFISFLYFYQICLGSLDNDSTNSKKKIIVIDDPVSSMDSQVLFIVSTLIISLMKCKDWFENCGLSKKEIRNYFSNDQIQQIFVLSHNLYFYKEVAFDNRFVCKDIRHYRILKSTDNITSIQLLDNKKIFFDDYKLMWESIKEMKNKNSTDFKNNIFIANTFRRILESYANFLGLGSDAWASIGKDDDKMSAEYILKCAFISQINDESHKVTPFDSYYFQKIHNTTPQKLFEVFESIFEVIGKEHYDMMMS